MPDQAPPPRFERPRRIRFSNCDPAGIVFFPQYLAMFNDHVEDWVNDGLGVSYSALLGPRRVGLPTVRLECDFHAVSRMGDEVTYGLAVQRLGDRSITLALDCRAGDELRVSIRQVLVVTSLETHRSIAMPPDLRQALERFVAGSPPAP